MHVSVAEDVVPLFVIHFLPTGTGRIQGGSVLFTLPQMLKPKSTVGDR